VIEKDTLERSSNKAYDKHDRVYWT